VGGDDTPPLIVGNGEKLRQLGIAAVEKKRGKLAREKEDLGRVFPRKSFNVRTIYLRKKTLKGRRFGKNV